MKPVLKGVFNYIIFRELIEKLYAKLCITVQLFHSPSKLGSGDIYQVIYQDLLDLQIETYLGEEEEVDKMIFQVGQLLVRSWK